jgi:hypothetical protein
VRVVRDERVLVSSRRNLSHSRDRTRKCHVVLALVRKRFIPLSNVISFMCINVGFFIDILFVLVMILQLVDRTELLVQGLILKSIAVLIEVAM